MKQQCNDTDRLADAVSFLAQEMCESRKQRVLEFDWLKCHSGLATRKDLDQATEKIMSAISDFLAKQKSFNDRQAAAIDSVGTSVTGLQGDIAELNRIITELQNSSGGVTPEDQALIDQLVTQGEATAAKVEAASTALSELDNQTPPVVPPTA